MLVDWLIELREAEQLRQKYRVCLDRALTAAGSGDAGWNSRFRTALARNGLVLGPAQRGAYPDGFSFQAPAPFPGDEDWPDGTHVIWA